MNKWYDIKAMAHGKPLIFIYGDIGENIWGEGTSAIAFARELKALGDVDTIEVRVNSRGGNVTEGQAIYSLLKDHSATIEMHIDGLAASIASLIVMAGDKVFMPPNALFCPHAPAGPTEGRGTAEDHRASAETLDIVKQTMAAAYAAKTGQDQDAMFEFLTDDSVMTAQEAMDYGFVDEISEPLKIVAKLEGLDDKKKIDALLANKTLKTPTKKKPAESATAKIDSAEKLKVIFEPIAKAMGIEFKDLIAAWESADFEGKETPNNSDDVVAILKSCTASGYPELASGFVESGKSLKEVEATMEVVAEIKDVCTAAGKSELADVLVQNSCFSVEAARAILLEARVGDDDEEIDGNHQDLPGDAQAKIDSGWEDTFKELGAIKS